MWWILFILLQAYFIITGIRNEHRAGLWSWSKFAFVMGFAALEIVIVITPILVFDLNGPYFLPVFLSAWVVAALNFIWMIIVARRWKLPDGRTSLQAYRDQQR